MMERGQGWERIKGCHQEGWQVQSVWRKNKEIRAVGGMVMEERKECLKGQERDERSRINSIGGKDGRREFEDSGGVCRR